MSLFLRLTIQVIENKQIPLTHNITDCRRKVPVCFTIIHAYNYPTSTWHLNTETDWPEKKNPTDSLLDSHLPYNAS